MYKINTANTHQIIRAEFSEMTYAGEQDLEGKVISK